MRGRKPKPTWLKLINGTPGHRALNAAEPLPVGELTETPEWLTETQKERWRYAVENAPAGLLKKLDRAAFTTYVLHEDARDNAARMVAKYGEVIKAPNTGVPMISPWLSTMNKQSLILIKATSELGFTPSSRSRVKVDKPTPGTNRFAELKELGDD